MQRSYVGTVIAACGAFPSITIVLTREAGFARGDVEGDMAPTMTIDNPSTT